MIWLVVPLFKANTHERGLISTPRPRRAQMSGRFVEHPSAQVQHNNLDLKA
jgi:hypothetical protein